MTEKERRQTVRISNIQRLCFHDGPGIRTTVFLKGCSIHCPWCANPENIMYEIQPYFDDSGKETGEYGMDITLEELLLEVVKDRNFYLNDGGVTFSGGEPLLQIEKYASVLRELKEMGIHLAVETALFVPESKVDLAKQYFDWFYIDMKILEPEECKVILGGNVGQYLSNLKNVSRSGKKICIRIPCSGKTVNESNVRMIADTMKENCINDVELFNLHDLGAKKYERLGWEAPVLDDKLDYAKIMGEILTNEGNKVTIITL